MASARNRQPSRSETQGRFQPPRRCLGRVGRGLRVAEHQPGQPRPMRLKETERHVASHRKPTEHDRLRDLQGVEHGGQVVRPFARRSSFQA